MGKASNHFIQLERSFHELAKYARDSDSFQLNQAFFVGPRLHWADLLMGYRTIILSEAGTGKTEEIREAAKGLRGEEKKAFFMRLEHIPDDFEDAFEVGTFEEFTEWLASTDEGWLLLDSVDEARLRNPGDFERAIRKLGRRIQAAADRVHIVLTGRTSAWRARTDLELCQRHLPFAPDTTKLVPPELPDEDALEDALDAASFDTECSREKETPSAFRIVTLDDLSKSQIEVFSQARGVTNTAAFLEEIERADAETFTTRPQDLEELLDFWKKANRIGTRLELMQNSVQRRLEERDQNHREAQPLPAQRAREGARLLAAASILGKEPTIQVPDGSHNKKGIPVRMVLSDWNDRDQQTLLSRPIFDEAIYGTVRFHHRSVREFLAAEWLAQLLERSSSRREVEALLFRVQYGVEVVVPTMRPVLPWLAILDDRIRGRILRIAPEVLFEGGDPSALPLATRKTTLAEVCQELASGKSGQSALDYAAVQRFANPDLADDIRTMLKAYASNAELVSFLMRMVWLGRLFALKGEAKALALSSTTPKYAREAAIRALRAVGTTEDLDDLRKRFASEAVVLNRDWLSEIVTASAPTPEITAWLLEALARAAPKKRFTVDSLTDGVATFMKATPIELLPKLAEGLSHLLEEPSFIERGFCDVSKSKSWLITPASIAVERLIRARRPEAIQEPALGILHKLKAAKNWDDDVRDVKAEFGKLVPAWAELNRAAFWYDVQATRKSAFYVKQKHRLISFWQASGLGYWDFGVEDFAYAADAIRASNHEDDKQVALTLAFDIYAKGNRPPAWLDRLRELVNGNAVLEERLENLLNPPVTEHEREEKKWKKRAAAREKRERDNRKKSKDFILANIELVRAPELKDPTAISSAQWHLHERLREKAERANRWTVGLWRELVPDFGEEVAQAYREGVTNYWRKYRPILRSEGAPTNSTPIFVIFGLAGLDIEAAETPNWPSSLSKEEVLLACRYASHELNGFPPWFPKLFAIYPDIVSEFLLSEIRSELSSEKPDEDSNYLLSDLSSSGQWAWHRIAPAMLDLLQTTNVANKFNLGRLLTIVQGSSSISDEDLATLARCKVLCSVTAEETATWFAVWAGVDPEQAIPHITAHLSTMADSVDQTKFAMNLVTRLLGGRRSTTNGPRQGFGTPKHLKDLFLLMQTYVREDEDINRSGTGVYSPGLRDNAQDARNALFNLLKQIPGKEAFVALSEIATQHPKAESRPWLASFARGKAEQDADLAPWLPTQVRDFHQHLDRTPTNHRELADIAVLRLLDLQDDLENGDDSVARVLQRVEEETEMRNYLAHELREKARGRYTITQEEELADSKRPDVRFHGAGFDASVPSELKLAERWTGPQLFERLEGQLSGDYLRDNRSARGIFLLVNRTKGRRWQLPSGERVDFDELLQSLRNHWNSITGEHPRVEDITVVGIDLSKRFG
ncbi:hypothetical protein [Bradyrhizobium sp. CCGE-LA001]|uniref:hypothetical protein n=1 Tax=Bradyrhizobium sp. CCGE-LA001 TaxID=1223566 RepID=UPI000745D829|nr:hypothetical protein [Bradyrhizobium sp. CCGE-LA001]AMA59430.1 hypothetical protein BCCGELA001_26275 [Bradyrhizobium sp. CCGE-LA001]